MLKPVSSVFRTRAGYASTPLSRNRFASVDNIDELSVDEIRSRLASAVHSNRKILEAAQRDVPSGEGRLRVAYAALVHHTTSDLPRDHITEIVIEICSMLPMTRDHTRCVAITPVLIGCTMDASVASELGAVVLPGGLYTTAAALSMLADTTTCFPTDAVSEENNRIVVSTDSFPYCQTCVEIADGVKSATTEFDLAPYVVGSFFQEEDRNAFARDMWRRCVTSSSPRTMNSNPAL